MADFRREMAFQPIRDGYGIVRKVGNHSPATANRNRCGLESVVDRTSRDTQGTLEGMGHEHVLPRMRF